MKFLTLITVILLVVFVSNAFAADVRCYDGLRHVVLGETGRVTLNGFDHLGTPTGSKFDCRGPIQACSRLLSSSQLLCQSEPEGRGHIVLNVSSVMGVRMAVLYGETGLPYFAGICSAFQLSY